MEYVKAQKAEAEAIKHAGIKTKHLTPQTPLNAFKQMGIKLKVNKGTDMSRN